LMPWPLLPIPYLNFTVRRRMRRIKFDAFQKMTETSPRTTPYASQRIVPAIDNRLNDRLIS